MLPRLASSYRLKSLLIVFLPLALWLMLIGSLRGDPDQISDIASPRSFFDFLYGVQSSLPLVTTFLAVAFMLFKNSGRLPKSSLFLGPLGLTLAYGLVGVIATTLSPDRSVAIYWSISYLSVPLVLWAIVTGPDPLDSVYRLVNLTLLIVISAAAIFFVFALIKLNLGSFLVHPGDWLECTQQGWYLKSSKFIRETGVGRYAAITGIVALVRIWHPPWRIFWTIVLLASVVLLLHTTARTSFVGFLVAVPVVIFLSHGQKAVLVSAIAAVALIPIFWLTGIHDDFIDNCILRSEKPPTLIAEQPDLSSAALIRSLPTTVRLPIFTRSNQALASSGQPGLGSIVSPQTQGRPILPNFATATSTVPIDAIVVDTGRIPSGFFNLTGRTAVWFDGLDLFGKSPWLGNGFQADRLLLGAHAHNFLIQALVQTGLLGTIPFILGLALAWILLLRSLSRITLFVGKHKILLIQTAGILTFLSVRSITESTGAFFSVDWLILAPHLLYIQVLISNRAVAEGR